MLRPMKRTPISVPIATLATRRPGVQSRNFVQERRDADVVRVHQQHRHEREVVGGREREEHEDLGGEPVAALDGRGEDALDEAIGARAGDEPGRERE